MAGPRELVDKSILLLIMSETAERVQTRTQMKRAGNTQSIYKNSTASPKRSLNEGKCNEQNFFKTINPNKPDQPNRIY